MATDRAVVESSSVRLDADSVTLSVSTKGIVTVEIKAYGDWSMESREQMSNRLEKGIETFKIDGKKLRDAFIGLNGEE